MVTASPTSEHTNPDAPLPLTLEILQGSKPSQQIPVRIKSLSARGVILASGQPPGDLNWEQVASRDSIIHLPTGEIRQIRGNLLWARPQDEAEPEMVFGLELSSSNLKVRRALEEQLMAYPQDLKNLWDHWDAVHEEYEAVGPGPSVSSTKPEIFPAQPILSPKDRTAEKPTKPQSASDNTIYFVGLGAVLAGVGVDQLAPDSYRMFGLILATYGSLTIVGKIVWSLLHRPPRPQE
jgi:hypothetical protein